MNKFDQKVFDWIMSTPSDVYYINKIVKQENRLKFIEALRNIIAADLDFKNNFELTFNENPERFRIIHISGFKTKITGRNQREGRDK